MNILLNNREKFSVAKWMTQAVSGILEEIFS